MVFDDVYGFLPPHPANPPTKRPLVALMKQARGFGFGVIIATQNLMDLDYYRAPNAGLWCLSRLQTDADRERVLDGLASAQGTSGELPPALDTTLKRLTPRLFVIRNAHSTSPPILLHPETCDFAPAWPDDAGGAAEGARCDAAHCRQVAYQRCADLSRPCAEQPTTPIAQRRDVGRYGQITIVSCVVPTQRHG